MKTSALKSNGEGLVYRGGMVFRRDTDGTLRFESAPLATGRMTADGIQYHITDHLGSVRAVIDAATGDILEASEYTAFGERTDITSAVRQGLRQVSSFGDPSLRHHFSGKEDQTPDFSVSSADFGARHYAPHLSRWMVPDPMGEKYYDISPYVYCANDPVNYVDPNGLDGVRFIDENGQKTIETNVVVLLQQEILITDEMTEREIRKTQRKNKRIRERNDFRLMQIESALNSSFGKKNNSQGESIQFVFNIIGIQVDNPCIHSSKVANSYAINYGIPAKTPDRNNYQQEYEIARASVISTDFPSGIHKGETRRGCWIILRDLEMDTIAHEEGHSLGLTHGANGGSSGLMHYPPESLTPQEVDLLWELAYEKK